MASDRGLLGPHHSFSPRSNECRKKRYSEMVLVTISFTFSSLDAIFQLGLCLRACSSVVWVSASTRWCRLPVQEPQQQGRCLTPSPFLAPPSQPLPLGDSAAPDASPVFASLFPAPSSFIYLLLSTRCCRAMFLQASRGLDKPAVQTCSAVAARGENCWVIAKRPGGKPQPFHSCLLSCTTLALHNRVARKTRHVGAALQGLL